MKIRNGFVSNSSSSSFLIYGASFSTDELLEALNIEDGDAWDAGDNVAKELDMEYQCPYGGDYGVYIGASWDSVGDDETGAQFKERIEKKLKEKFGDKISIGTHAESWYDG